MTVRTPIVLVGREHVPLSEDDTLSVPVPLSGSEDNLLSNTASGLMAELHVDPTGSVQLSGKGTSAKPLSGSLKLDPVAGNLLSDSAAGVKVAVVVGKGQTAVVGGSGTETDPLVAEVTLAGDAGQRLQVLQDKGLYVGPEAISAEAGNALERKEDGLFASGGSVSVTHNATLDGDGTAESPLGVKVSTASGNQLTTTAEGLFVAAQEIKLDTSNVNRLVKKADGSLFVPNIGGASTTTAQVSVTPKSVGGNATVTVQSIGVDIVFSQEKANIATRASDGVFVDGTHRIIPKFYATTIYPLLDADQVTTYPDGTIRTEVTWSGINPPAAGGVSAYTLSQVQSKVRLMDASGNPVKVQLELVRVSGANWKLVALLSGKPASAYYIDNNTAYPGDGKDLSNFPVGITMLYGYNPTQLGLA